MQNIYDLFIIGGGINGTGIAVDAAGRGLRVALAEQDDLAAHTSSASSKLIHGGLRYLELYEFRLVHEALVERDILWRKAPHLIHPLRIIMPHNRLLRPAWMIRIGLFLYDHLHFKQRFPKSQRLRIAANQSAEPLNSHTTRAFVYSDATVDDARLVVANALQAQALGADILVRHVVEKAERNGDHWHITLYDKNMQQSKVMQAKALVNAAGPWVDALLQNQLKLPSKHHIRLVKGSHLVVRKLYEGQHAYLLQNDDRRVVFVIPYREQFTLIGTTDVTYTGDPNAVRMDETEQAYLFSVVNAYFKKTISTDDVVWHYSGVRPLQSDDHANPTQVTRDYSLDIQDQNGALPILSVFGGKITTYRTLAEHALKKLIPYFPTMKKPWTANAPIPGGDIDDFDTFVHATQQRYPWLETTLLTRLCNAYGTRIHDLLKNCDSPQALGQYLGGSLYAREVDYLIKTEWAQTAEDILWRRTKQGLLFTPEQIQKLTDYMHVE